MMARIRATLLLALAGLVCTGSLAGCNCASLMIQDPALESAIRAELGMPLGCLTLADLAQVTELQADGLNITTLQGLELLPNLTILNVQNNQIRSVTPLTNLTNLEFLDLGFNNISNIEPLSGLFNLDTLFLDGNNLFDLGPLTANVLNGGLGADDTVVLPASILDGPGGEVQQIFQGDVNTLTGAGVRVFVEIRPEGA